MRTVQLDIYTSLPATIVRYLEEYGVSTEVVRRSKDGYVARFHGSYEDLYKMLTREYGADEEIFSHETVDARKAIAWVRAHLDSMWVELDTSHRAQFDNEVYEATVELAISLLTNVGYGPDDKDSANNEISDVTQFLLTEAILRAPQLAGPLKHLDMIQSQAIVQFRELQERNGDK